MSTSNFSLTIFNMLTVFGSRSWFSKIDRNAKFVQNWIFQSHSPVGETEISSIYYCSCEPTMVHFLFRPSDVTK